MKTQTLLLAMALLLTSSVWAFEAETAGVNTFVVCTNQIEGDTISADQYLNLDEQIEEEFPGRKEVHDTMNVRIGKHLMTIESNGNSTNINIEKSGEFESRWKNNEPSNSTSVYEINPFSNHDHYGERWMGRHNLKEFRGHWAGIDLGGNLLWDVQYPSELYPSGTPDFLETRADRSVEFNFNFCQYSFGFNSYVGLVTGLGLNFNNYKFNNPYTLVRNDDGILTYDQILSNDFQKSKLTTTFLTAPFMLEFQIPGQYDKRLFVSAGVIGGVKLGQHTKIKADGNKLKNRNDLNINPLRWGYTARIGFEDFGIFATYYNTKLFENNVAPVVTPWTVGIVFTAYD